MDPEAGIDGGHSDRWPSMSLAGSYMPRDAEPIGDRLPPSARCDFTCRETTFHSNHITAWCVRRAVRLGGYPKGVERLDRVACLVHLRCINQPCRNTVPELDNSTAVHFIPRVPALNG